MFDSINLQGVMSFARDVGAKPETLQTIGALALFVIVYHVTNLTYAAFRGPVSFGWWTAKLIAGGAFGLSKLGFKPLAWMLTTQKSELCKAIMASLSEGAVSDRDDTVKSSTCSVTLSPRSRIRRRTLASALVNTNDVLGRLTKADRRAIAKAVLPIAQKFKKDRDEAKAKDDEIMLSLLVESAKGPLKAHFCDTPKTVGADLRGGTNRVSTHTELAHAITSGKYPYG